MNARRRAATAAVNIPPAPSAALKMLAALDDSEFERLREALASAEPFQGVADLQERARRSVSEPRREDAEALVPALLGLSTLSRSGEVSALAEAASNSPDLQIDAADRETLAARLEALMQTSAIYSTAAAIDLLTQAPRNYRTARVVSDIRPVFPQDVAERPAGAVLVHTLGLQTWDRDGNSETLHIAMDEPDLRELRQVVDRALSKTETLLDLLQEQQIAYFQLDERTR